MTQQTPVTHSFDSAVRMRLPQKARALVVFWSTEKPYDMTVARFGSDHKTNTKKTEARPKYHSPLQYPLKGHGEKVDQLK